MYNKFFYEGVYMGFYERNLKSKTIDWLKQHGDPHEYESAEAAFNGDAEAAFDLSIALKNDKRGLIAVQMWRAKVPINAFQAYLSSVWGHDHRYVIRDAGSKRILQYMFRYAKFPIPEELPSVVTVWRGTSYLPFKEAKTGFSWTTDRDMACWFAMRFADRNSSPLVLTADVAKSEISLFNQEREESEIVLLRPPSARIDGDVSDWMQGYKRKEEEINPDRTMVEEPEAATA